MGQPHMPMAEKKKLSRKAAKIFSYATLFVFCFFSLAATSKLYGTWKTNETNDTLRELKADFVDTGKEDEWTPELLSINEDYVGWLTVYGTGADGPVVQGEDNDEYLRKDFYGNYQVSGTFFMDEMVDVEDETGNRIIYGHMMNDNTMFGSFKQYKNLEFFKKNNIIRWEDRFGESYYKLFAALLVSGSATNTNYLNIQQWAGHLDEEQTQEMLQTLKERAYLYQEDPFRGEGQYIFLVTCEYSQYKGKLVLVGEKL